MNVPSPRANFSPVVSVCESIGQPTFLLDVLGENQFRFVHLNACHAIETGLDPSAFAGRLPHDVLPPAVADTVIANYEQCRVSGKPFSYVENLQLETGARWWRTTLSPLFDETGEMTQILGVAVDITESKAREFDLTSRLSEAQKLNDEIRQFAASAAYDVRGPFKTILGLLELVKDGFLDLGDEKLDQIRLCEQTAMEAMERSMDIVSQANALKTARIEPVPFDLGHVCRDILALVDPEQRFQTMLPRRQIKADWAATQMILRCFIQTSARYAENEISISVDQGADGFLQFEVCDDGFVSASGQRSDGEPILARENNSNFLSEVSLAAGLVSSRDGFVEGLKRDARGAKLRFSLPGELVQ